jgi:hypothetical protein
MIDRRNFLKFAIAFLVSFPAIEELLTSTAEAAKRAYPNWGGMLNDYFRREFNKNRFEVEGKVILDRLTGLMWTRNNLPFGTIWPARSYTDAEETIETLNEDNYGGYNGWRIPGEFDWITVIDKRNRRPVLVEGFNVGDIVYKFPYWIKKEDREHKECAQLDGAVSCLPPKNGILLDNGVLPYVITYGMILPVRTHDKKHYLRFSNSLFDLMNPNKREASKGTFSITNSIK